MKSISKKPTPVKEWLQLIFLAVVMFTVISTNSLAQDTEETKPEAPKSFRELFMEAGYHVEFKSYNLALPVYLEMEKMESDNANIQYRIGFCYVNSANEKAKAIPYLVKAVKSASKNYDDLAHTEKNAPIKAYFELAKAYHLNNQIDTAIGTYKAYSALLHKKHYMQEDVTRRVEMCNYAKEKIANPINVKITNLGEPINTVHSDFCPIITADESMMIFTSRREIEGAGEINVELDGTFFEDIYVSYNDSGTWSAPEPIGSSINQIGEHDAAIGLSADGQRLFVYRDEEGGNIHQSYLMGDIWTVPEPTTSNINSPFWETHASISSDGQTLYFVSDRQAKKDPTAQYGARDIYKCTMLPNGEWSEAVNLGPGVNTKYDEDAPFIHPNGTRLYFSSMGHKSMGGFDIFFSELQEDGTWSEATNIGYPINTTNDDIFYVETPNGKKAYYSSVNVELGYGEKDIYMAELIDNKEVPLTLLKGVMAVTDADGIPLDASIIVTDTVTDKEITYKPNSVTGKFLVVLPPGTSYKIDYSLDDSVITTTNLNIASDSKYQEIEQTISLEGALASSGTEPEEVAVVEPEEPVQPEEPVKPEEPEEPVKPEEPVVVEKVVVEDFKEFFNYNVKSIKTSSKSYKNLISSLGKAAAQSDQLSLSIEASASKVPTSSYGSNETLASKRGDAAKARVLKSLKAKGIDAAKVSITITPLVQGPDYNEDAVANRATYEKYQYVLISVK